MKDSLQCSNEAGRGPWSWAGFGRPGGLAALVLALAGCGGGSSGSSEAVAPAAAAASAAVGTASDPNTDGSTATIASLTPRPGSITRNAAARFLTQATFGPTDASIDRVLAIGYSAWIDEQLAKPASLNRPLWEAADAVVKAASTTPAGSTPPTVGQDGTTNAFWKNAITADDQLRQRVAFALSQIFVVSMVDSTVGNDPRSVAAYLDMLGSAGLGSYRGLIEAVAMHPVMGIYLTSIRNQKADPRTGRVPDENFGREVMQLMSIGLHELNADGSEKLANGSAIDTYTQAEVGGMAKVFTGWSWACPGAPASGCFYNGTLAGVSDPDRGFKSMVGYPAYHSTEEKKFLGTTIPAQPVADPAASLKAALDTLAAHPNVGPFIGRQLIQRLVTSNPSPAYVSAVASAFTASGGDMKAVVKAVLLNPEARVVSTHSGKVREPVLRLSAFLRAFPMTSDTGDYRVGNTDNPGTQLGQTPMRAPSVFNFYRPGYIPPGSMAERSGLAAPEMQLVQETSAAGYVNYMRDNVSSGVGSYNGTVAGVVRNRRDLQPDYSAEMALADKSADLLDRLNARLMYGTMPAALKAEIQGAVEKIVIPALNVAGSNQAAVDVAKTSRVRSAILLTLASPEFQVQR